MKSPLRDRFAISALILGLLTLTAAAGPWTVSVNLAEPGAETSPDFLGLSFETSLMLPDSNGVHYFRADNHALVRLFKTIGVRSLRIGGNSVDAPTIPIPDEKDVMDFFEFARAAGVKVIYSVRLEESTNSGALPPSTAASNTGAAARVARLIHDRYAEVLDCFAIGNEPSYFKDYAVYSPKWKFIRDAIVAEYPEAKFCGPDQNPSPDLDSKMVRDFGNETGRLAMITQHSYPMGCAYKNPKERDVAKLVPNDAAASREKMLSPATYKTYDGIYKGINGAIAGTSILFRLSECNSYWFSGLKGASDSYASALWAADYLHWWADHGAAGLNLHTGDRTGGDLSMPCRYAAFVSAAHGYEARPLAYGMKLFDLGGHGRRLAVSALGESNMVVYASLQNDTVAVTLINKSHGPEAKEQAVEISVNALRADSDAKVIFLTARNSDLAEGSAEVTLGGTPIAEDGNWNGRWTPLPSSAVSNGVINVTMPPASAAVVRAVVGQPSLVPALESSGAK
jgi:hypothetical protein